MAATDPVTMPGPATAFAIGELVRRVEFGFVRRHPLLAELLEGGAHRSRRPR